MIYTRAYMEAPEEASLLVFPQHPTQDFHYQDEKQWGYRITMSQIPRTTKNLEGEPFTNEKRTVEIHVRIQPHHFLQIPSFPISKVESHN